MDLNSMLNDGPPPPLKKPSQSASPQILRDAPPPMLSTPGATGHAPAGESYVVGHRTPLHGPGPAPPGASLSRSNTGLTSLQMPGQSQNGQYPFPQQLAQSPATRQYEAYTVSTPGARPVSHGYSYPQPSPSQHPPTGVPSAVYQHPKTSLSPTPPSHHSQNTPHSVRQSPMSVMSQSIHQPPTQHHYQHSQPNTPLGPPSLHYQRTSYHSSHPDVHSPYHQRQRTLSGTSNGIVSNSPAQNHPSIGNLVESPNPYNNPHHLRRTSDYLSQMERERSVSVSPKTKVPPRPPSMSSRHNSQQEIYGSARSSMQAPNAAPLAETPRHVSQPHTQNAAQPPQPQSSNGVGQNHHASAQTPHPYPTAGGLAPGAASLSQDGHAGPPLPVQHQTQKMAMNHLLTPASSITSMDGPADTAPPARQRQSQQPSLFMKPSPKSKLSANRAAPSGQQSQEMQSIAVDAAMADDSAQSISTSTASPEVMVIEQTAGESRKRPADHEASVAEEPPMKRGKLMRKYSVRPVWARLRPDNELYRAAEHGPPGGQGRPSKLPTQAPAEVKHEAAATHISQANGNSTQAPQQTNGHPIPNGYSTELPPWQQNPPLDQDLIHCRRVLGQWEKTIKWNTPYPDMLRTVQDWLFQQLAQLGDVGHDPLEGTIEIEAKIGKIIRKGDDDTERLKLPVMSMTVLNPSFNERIRFESEMEQHEHAAMNSFLNTAIQASTHTPGRIGMHYSHPRQTDSFRTLSPAGIQALPAALQRRPLGRELRLRTSTDTKSKEVLARIVKINIADLHIFNPAGDYDCRISINLEVNLNRPDLNPADLFDEPTGDKLAPPDRRKDRLSYRHLNTYSIDLTRVDVEGIAPKFELELEVESRVLRHQMKLMQRGEPHAFGDVVSGFLDNATFLMRCRATAP